MKTLTNKIYEAKNLDMDEYKEGMIVRMESIVYTLTSKYMTNTSKIQLYLEPLDNKLSGDIPSTLKYFIRSKQIDILAPSILEYHSPFAAKSITAIRFLSGGKEIDLPKNMEIEIPEGSAVTINIIDRTTSNFKIRVFYRNGNSMNYFSDQPFESKREATDEGWEI